MAQVVPYDFKGYSLRILPIQGDPWFVAGDAARMLGQRDAANLTRGLDDDEKGTHKVSTPAGDQEVSVISEAGLYRAIMQRRASDTVPVEIRERIARFQRWAFHDVLPSIRRTGRYDLADQEPVVGSLPAEVVELIRRTDGIVRMLANKVTGIQARIESLEDRHAVPALDFGGTVTAYQIIEMAGVPLVNRQRGTAQMVTRRLMAFCAEHEVACFRTPAEVNPSRPFRFPQALAGEWLVGESRGGEHIRAQIERMKSKKRPRAFGDRQAALQLAVPGHPSSKRKPEDPLQ